MYKVGSKATAWFGAFLIVAGSVWLAAINTTTPYWYIVGVMVVIGFGMGCSTTPLTVLVQSAVGWDLRGVATASNSFMRSLGQMVGIAIFGTVFNNSLSRYVESHVPGGWQGGDISNILMSAPGSVPPMVLVHLREGMAHSLHVVFLLILAFSIITLIISTALPSHSKVMAQQHD